MIWTSNKREKNNAIFPDGLEAIPPVAKKNGVFEK